MPKWLKVLCAAAAALALAYVLTRIPWGGRGPSAPEGVPGNPVKLRVDTPTTGVAVELKDGAWRLTDPLDAPADPDVVGNVLAGMRRLALESAVTDDAGTHGQYLLADADALRFQAWEAGASAPFMVLLGKNAGFTGRSFVRTGASPRVYLATGLSREMLNIPLARWRDRRVLRRSDVVRVDVARGKERFTVAKSAAGWTLDGAAADAVKMDDFASALRTLSADDMVDPPAALDLKARGLDKPSAEFTVHFSSGAPVSLSFGRGEPRPVRKEGAASLYLVPGHAVKPLDLSREELLPSK